MEKSIKEVYNISFDLTDIPAEERYPIHNWYNDLIDKNFNQLTLFDVTRMLIQKILIELAVAKAILFLKENPFCGQRYEGELLEILYNIDIQFLLKYIRDFDEIYKIALEANKRHEWLCEEEATDFFGLWDALLKKLHKDECL